MAASEEERHDLSPGEAAFVEFLAEQDSGHPVEFEAFVARHPAQQLELRRLHEEWLSVARVLRRGRDEATPRAVQLEELCFDAQGVGLKLEFAGELVRRLALARTASDRYESRGELGRGGMGVVYRVWDPHLRRQLAMKVILARRDVATPEERSGAMHRALARFLEEAQVTSQLDHPGVVPVHDLGIDSKGRVYFTMRLVHGRDFRRILELARKREEGWTRARALGVLLKVCEAVGFAHSKGVIHRDLKPANVMTGRFGEVYVMDWGLARVLGRKDPHDLRVSTDTSSVSRIDTDVRRFEGQSPGSPLLTMDGRVVGTPSYMSPEQARNRVDDLGPPTDVYAIGAMLYHLLTGQMPYVPPRSEVSPANVYNMLLAGPPPPVKQLAPETPDELASICEKAMARDPEARYATPLDLAHDVEAYLDHRPVTARAFSLGYALRLFWERNRAFSVTGLAALLLLTVVVGVAWRENRRREREKEELLALRSAQVLASAVDTLPPIAPERAASMRRWLDEVDEVLARKPEFVAQLAAARRGGDPATGGGDAARVALLEAPVADLERLERKLRPQVAAWWAQASGLAHTSLEETRQAWQEAIDDIAMLSVYGGLELKPQIGLVPLRVDPASGLWEFWHVLSGARPVDDATTPSGYRIAPETGIVLVLIPGGITTIGSPLEEKDRDSHESLPQKVAIEPFFLGKFEVTQAQWERVLGERPSLYGPGAAILSAGRSKEDPAADADVHPVESVNWDGCVRFLQRVGLRLPLEQEWEHAARGGTTTAYWFEAQAQGTSPQGFENVADRRCWEETRVKSFDFDDGFAAHAPVGSFRANPFGLFDVAGNVGEWCEEWFRSVSPDDVPRRRIVRGGTWFCPAWVLRSAFRQWDNPIALNQARGVRAARSVDR